MVPGCPPLGSTDKGFTAWISAFALPRTAIAGFVYVMGFTSFLVLSYAESICRPENLPAGKRRMPLCIASPKRAAERLPLRWATA